MILIVLISVFLIPINKSIAASDSYSVVHIACHEMIYVDPFLILSFSLIKFGNERDLAI